MYSLKIIDVVLKMYKLLLATEIPVTEYTVCHDKFGNLSKRVYQNVIFHTNFYFDSVIIIIIYFPHFI